MHKKYKEMPYEWLCQKYLYKMLQTADKGDVQYKILNDHSLIHKKTYND